MRKTVYGSARRGAAEIVNIRRVYGYYRSEAQFPNYNPNLDIESWSNKHSPPNHYVIYSSAFMPHLPVVGGLRGTNVPAVGIVDGRVIF